MGVRQEFALTSDDPNAFKQYCDDASQLASLCSSFKASYEEAWERVGTLPPGAGLSTSCTCLPYQKTGVPGGRRLQAAGSSIVVTNSISCAGGCSPAQTSELLADSEGIGASDEEFTLAIAMVGVPVAIVSGTGYTAEVPVVAVPPSPPAPPPPPCISMCNTYVDGASSTDEAVCVHYQPFGQTACRPPVASAGVWGCDAQSTVCIQSACAGKANKKQKKCDKLSLKGAEKVLKKCKKKKTKRKCKLTCCLTKGA